MSTGEWLSRAGPGSGFEQVGCLGGPRARRTYTRRQNCYRTTSGSARGNWLAEECDQSRTDRRRSKGSTGLVGARSVPNCAFQRMCTHKCSRDGEVVKANDLGDVELSRSRLFR
jgi:hypothetical protein